MELHFSPGAKGCEEDKNLPSGFGYRPASREVRETARDNVFIFAESLPVFFFFVFGRNLIIFLLL